MKIKHIIFFGSGGFLLVVSGLIGLVLLGAKFPPPLASIKSNSVNSSAIPAQNFSINGNIFANNEPVRGESIYLCQDELYETANTSYQSSVQKDIEARKIGAWTDSTWAFMSIAKLISENKNPGQFCEISTNTDANGSFQFTQIKEGKYFLMTKASINKRSYAWLNPIILDKTQQITLSQ
jgi:hypothetical protein